MLRRAKAGRKRSCLNNKLKRNTESTQNHFAFAVETKLRRPI
jgi:hypothetical protein